MRWRDRTKPLPKDGSTRTVKMFCWWPTWIDGSYVWLESVVVHQQCQIINDSTCGETYPQWTILGECHKSHGVIIPRGLTCECQERFDAEARYHAEPIPPGNEDGSPMEEQLEPGYVVVEGSLQFELNRLELEAENLECAHLWLDDQNIPRYDATPDKNEYSLVGRIEIYGERKATTPEHVLCHTDGQPIPEDDVEAEVEQLEQICEDRNAAHAWLTEHGIPEVERTAAGKFHLSLARRINLFKARCNSSCIPSTCHAIPSAAALNAACDDDELVVELDLPDMVQPETPWPRA